MEIATARKIKEAKQDYVGYQTLISSAKSECREAVRFKNLTFA
jgi:hypothetical protein